MNRTHFLEQKKQHFCDIFCVFLCFFRIRAHFCVTFLCADSAYKKPQQKFHVKNPIMNQSLTSDIIP